MVRSPRGIRDNKALKALEATAEGRDGLSRLLLFLDAPSEAEQRLLALLEDGDARSLAALLKESGVSPAALALSVANAKMAFEREVARADAVDAMPAVIADLRQHAIDRLRKCTRCFGYKGKTGLGKTVVVLGTEEAVCPECDGCGQTMQSSTHKQWAATTLGKIAALPEERSGGVNVNVQTNVAVKAGGSADFMERLAKAAHAVIGRTEIVEAEVVKAVPSEPVPSTPTES